MALHLMYRQTTGKRRQKVAKMLKDMGADPARPPKQLKVRDVPRVEKEADRLHNELELAVEAGNVAKQSQLAGEIGHWQAMINALEGEAYKTGGAINRMVVLQNMGNVPAFGSWPKGLTIPEYFAAAIDQFPFLWKSLGELELAIKLNKDPLGAIRAPWQIWQTTVRDG